MPQKTTFYAMASAYTGETPNFIPAAMKIPLRHSQGSGDPGTLARTNPAMSSATAREFMMKVYTVGSGSASMKGWLASFCPISPVNNR